MAQKIKVQAKTKAQKAPPPVVKKTAVAPVHAKAAVRSAPPAAIARAAKTVVSPAPAAAKSVKVAVAAKAAVKPVAPVKAQPAKTVPVNTVKKPFENKAAPAMVAGKPAVGFKPAAAVKPAATPVLTRPGMAATANKFRAASAALAKNAAPKITAPVAPATVATPKAIAEKAAAARQIINAQKKPVNQRHGFKTNEFIVYPAHGVGRIIAIEEQEIAGMALELFVINFDKEKLTLRVPTGKLQSVGMRKHADDDIVRRAMDILKGRARVKRTMWSRRAQEYVAKINSGDLISIAEVVRDLYRSEAQPEQSYSERQLYEDALDRMAREIAAVEKLDGRGAVQRITDVLAKSARGRRLAEDGDAKAA